MYNSKRWFKLLKFEVLCTKTVHAAVNKACELLDLKMVYVELDENNIMDVTIYIENNSQLCYNRFGSLFSLWFNRPYKAIENWQNNIIFHFMLMPV